MNKILYSVILIKLTPIAERFYRVDTDTLDTQTPGHSQTLWIHFY